MLGNQWRFFILSLIFNYACDKASWLLLRLPLNSEVIFFKIPIQIEYVYPKGVFRPIFAYGLNIYNDFFFTTGILGGFNINLDKYCSINCYYEMDFNNILGIPLVPGRSIFSQSVLAGFKIKL